MVFKAYMTKMAMVACTWMTMTTAMMGWLVVVAMDVDL